MVPETTTTSVADSRLVMSMPSPRDGGHASHFTCIPVILTTLLDVEAHILGYLKLIHIFGTGIAIVRIFLHHTAVGIR